jgi:hypothetical protein
MFAMPHASERGTWRSLSPARKFVADMLHFAKQVPSIPVARTINVAALAQARTACTARPSWTAVFMKAYALVCQRHAPLRWALISWPWEHLYEHPLSVCGAIVEREHLGEHILLGVQIRGPEEKSLLEIDEYLQRVKETPVDQIGYFRRVLFMGRLPKWLRRFMWWQTLHISGYKRAKRLGTFGLSSYGRLGAEQIHPLGPLSTLLTFGPISPGGDVIVKIVYDHRVLDGAQVARYLAEMEQILHIEIRGELRQLAGDKRVA